MKKIIALILAFMIVIAALTACSGGTAVNDTAEVPEATTYTSAKAFTLGNKKTETINSGGQYSFSGTLSDGQIVVDTSDRVYIELAGVSITNTSGPAIQINNAKEVTLTLKTGTTNELTDGGSSEFNSALFSNDTLIIEGEGELIITGNNEHGIESDDDVLINGGDITITAKNDGIHANDNITVNGGAINIKEAVEGIESKNDIVINSGNITILASDDGINAATDITINGGNVHSKSTRADAIDSNGTINIKGGTTVAVGGNQPECGIDSDNNNFSITGGTLIAAGGSNSMPSASSTTQPTVMLGVTSKNGIIHIEGEDGGVLTFKTEQNAQSMVFSSPKLALGKTYTIYTDGSITGGTSFNGLYTDAQYSGGTKGDSFTTSSTVTIQGGNTGMGGGRTPGMGGERMPGAGGGGRRPGDGQNMPPDMQIDRKQ